MSYTLILVIVLVVFLTMFWYHRERDHHKKHYTGKPFFAWRRIRKPVLVLSIILLPILLVNLIFPPSPDLSPAELVDEGIAHNDPNTIAAGYARLIEQYPDSIDLHVHIISTIYRHRIHNRMDKDSLLKDYEQWTDQEDQDRRDLAHICQGFIYMYEGDLNNAMKHFVLVQNSNRRFNNYGTALVMTKLMDFRTADSLFHAEIETNGYIAGSIRQLAWMYSELSWDPVYAEKLDELMHRDEALHHVNPSLKRSYYYKDRDIYRYFAGLLIHEWDLISPKGALAALLVMLAWLVYIRNLDVYEPERWSNLIITFALGFICTYLVMPLHDILLFELGFDLTGGPVNDFFYCWFGIGAVEEIVKIIPFLFMLKFSKAINESYDYILYASVAALGFAFNENLLYYQEGQLNIISARALYTSVGHMFWSSTIAYGLLLNKLRWHRNPVLIFMGFYLLASLGHGFYDYWIINEWAQRFAILTTLFFLLSLHVWVVYINNALNNSHFFDHRKKVQTDHIQLYLLIALLSIFMFEYSILGYKYGAASANENLMSHSLFTVLFILYIASSLSNFELVKGHWSPIRFPKNLLLPRMAGDTNYSNLHVKLTNTVGNFYLKPHLPVTGTISERMVISGSKDWYMVNLDQPIRFRNFVPDKVIIQSRHPYNNFQSDPDVVVYLMMIPNADLLERDELDTADLRFMGYVVLNNVN